MADAALSCTVASGAAGVAVECCGAGRSSSETPSDIGAGGHSGRLSWTSTTGMRDAIDGSISDQASIVNVIYFSMKSSTKIVAFKLLTTMRICALVVPAGGVKLTAA